MLRFWNAIVGLSLVVWLRLAVWLRLLVRLPCRLEAIIIVGLWFLAGVSATADQPLSYDRDVRPILSENCFACHGFDEKSREASLRLDTRAGAVDDSGAIVPGCPDSSLIVQRMLSESSDERMPPPHSGKQLDARQVEIVKRWIAEGAVYERHWAFMPPHVSELPPEVTASTSHPIDRLISAKLSEHGLSLSPSTSPATLIRRLSLDLIGLPPTPDEVRAFEVAAAQDAEAAINTLIGQLLSSPHYGERWGRWWLDQARYADSHGYSIDGEREMWNYRDWVINALNRDMGFDQFTIEQLAGDLLPNATLAQRVATGFHRNTQINQEGGVDPEQFRMDSIFDRVATTGNVWLGLSVGCAQCHDHKFDPISQREYYQLFAFLNNQMEPEIRVYPPHLNVEELESRQKSIEAQLNEELASYQSSYAAWEGGLDDAARKNLDRNIERLLSTPTDKRKIADRTRLLLASGLVDSSPQDIEQGQTRDQLQQALNDLKQIAEELSQASSALVLQELDERRKSFVLIKGDFTRPDAEVSPGTPSILHPLVSTIDRVPNRLDLAQWLIDDDNPLTARVIANRVWQQLFGRGLVETENDFGLQGTPPSHPELLDWLAIEFRSHNWSVKHLIRTIVSSRTYQQSSVVRDEFNQVDPLNYLLGRQNRLRLDAELVRDSALVASGLFCDQVGGPSVRPPIPDGVMNQGQVKRDWKADEGDNRYRRAMYTFAYRVTPPPALSVFDAPDGLSTCTRRIRSNTPLQALTLLNDPAFVEFATAMEKIVTSEGLEIAFQRCTSRLPTQEELELLEQLDSFNAARALLNLDETITRE